MRKLLLGLAIGAAIMLSGTALAQVFDSNQVISPVTSGVVFSDGNPFNVLTTIPRVTPAFGGTGTSTVPLAGQVLLGQADGTYAPVATSTLGLGGSGGGSVTSVAATVPTGLQIAGSPITTSGTLAITYASGYAIPTTASTTDWQSFYTTPSTRITAGDGLSWAGNTLNAEVETSDLHDPVTLAGSPDYLTLAGQVITRALIDLTSHVTGRLPFANYQQGTALSVVGRSENSTGDVANISAGTNHQVLRRSGTTLGFGAIDLSQTAATTGLLPYNRFSNGTALSVVGRAANSTGVQASIAAGTDHQVLRRSGTALGFGAIALDQSAAVTGALGATNGGTGQSTVTTGDLLYGSASNVWSKRGIGSTGNVLSVVGGLPTWVSTSSLNISGGSAQNIFDFDTNTPFGSPLNDTYRIRHSFNNFLNNSAFQHWFDGTSSAPTGWTLQNDVTIARSSTATIGDYSTQLTFGTANTGEFFQAFDSNTLVDYTFSAYVQRTSGSGNARLVAQENGGSFTEFVSVGLPTGAGWQLVTLTVQPSSGTSLRFNIKSTDDVASTWLIDEVMAQESKGVATTWLPRYVDDTFGGDILGTPYFRNSTYSAIFSGGNVGIGSSTPSSKLSVDGDVALSGLVNFGNGMCMGEDTGTTTPNVTIQDCADF